MVTEEKPHRVGIFENKIEIIRGISSKPSTNFQQLELDPASVGRVIDIKFLSEHILVVLCQSEGTYATQSTAGTRQTSLLLLPVIEHERADRCPLDRSTTKSLALILPNRRQWVGRDASRVQRRPVWLHAGSHGGPGGERF